MELRAGKSQMLLNQKGADIYTNNSPAVLMEFHRGFRDVVFSLLHHGAQLDCFGEKPLTWIGVPHARWQINLLRSIGFSDWDPSDPACSNMLCRAAITRDAEMILFALECIKLDPNAWYLSPFKMALLKDDIYISAILLECDAKLLHNNRVLGLFECPNFGMRNFIQALHWVIFRGAIGTTPSLLYHPEGIWCGFWRMYECHTVRFIEVKLFLTHLLYHDVDPHERSMILISRASVSRDGSRYWGRDNAVYAAKVFDYELDTTDGSRVATSYKDIYGYLRNNVEDRDGEAQEEDTDGEPDNTHRAPLVRTPLTPAALEYRFPHVRMFFEALRLAGYRAEIDDDGDVWYEDDDGDRYFDAREYQPEESDSAGGVVDCPICRDPAKYGLGHMVEEDERGRRAVYEYREKIRRHGWPYL